MTSFVGVSSASNSFETAGYPPLMDGIRQIIIVYPPKHPKILGLHFVRYLIFDKQGLSELSVSAGICHGYSSYCLHWTILGFR